MAIVFTSPEKKQSAILFIVIALSVVVLIVISGIIFLPEFLPKNSTIPVVPFTPEVVINSTILDSDKVKSLEPVDSLPIIFTYTVQDQAGKQTQGNISAASRQEAQTTLEGGGFKVISLEQVNVGRVNPFVSY